MNTVLRWTAPIVGVLFTVSFVAAQEATGVVTENRTVGHLIISALASATVTLLYVAALRVTSRKRA